MPEPTAVVTVLDRIVANTLSYALLLAAIGTLSMAFIELMKNMFNLRRRFNRRRFYHWMDDPDARTETLILTTGGVQFENVLFEQPIERMLGQIQAAANLSLEYPDRYRKAYAFFTNEDLEVRKAYLGRSARADNEVWSDFASGAAGKGLAATKAGSKQEAEARAAQQARVRLGNLIARRLDAFQNRTQYLWARGNQSASVLVGGLLTAYVITRGRAVTGPEDVIALVCVSLLAGMVAPFAKDIVSSLSGIRTRA